ncbi:methyltransferase domain-containing protein [Candidatus Woesearchaeota archaeon]|nr:methyltransferase domain-containing protein [Candidatus Woesearchaeota archaeon]
MWKFVQQFLESPGKTGAVLPSSKSLAKRMCSYIDFSKAQTIVELGAGTGAITRELLARMSAESKLVAFEINAEFCYDLRRFEDKRMLILNEDARRLSSLVKHADYVVSGLPLVAFDEEAHREVLNEIAKITRHRYIQFHYSSLGEKYLLERFGSFEREYVLRNAPPAFVYMIDLEKK